MAYSYTTHRGTRVSYPHRAMLRAYEVETGAAVHVNEGARTIREQTAFWLHYLRYGHPLAARPNPGAPHIKYGRRNHAMDINAPHPAQDVAAFYRRHGVPVAFNVPGEPWHMDTLDEDALLRAAAKLSAHADPTGDPTLKLGSSGGHVIRLKKLLYAQGIRDFSGSPAHPNSNRFSLKFGTNTAAAVRRFQKAHNLPTDSVVGPRTWKALHG